VRRFVACESMAAIATPCVKICVLDRETRLCIGCGRTGDEIGAWTTMSDAERQRIMDELPNRLARLAAYAQEQERRA
jgi:predicted Fe-S protein YdhL (DUF1289 family)